LPHIRKKIAHLDPALTVLLKFPRRPQQIPRLAELHPRLPKRIRLPIIPDQERLGIESIHLRGPAMHKEEYDPLRPRRKHGRPGIKRRLGIGFRHRSLLTQQTRQRHHPKPRAALLQHLASSYWPRNIVTEFTR